MVKMGYWISLESSDHDGIDRINSKCDEIKDQIKILKNPTDAVKAVVNITTIVTSIDDLLKEQKKLIRIRSKIQKKL